MNIKKISIFILLLLSLIVMKPEASTEKGLIYTWLSNTYGYLNGSGQDQRVRVTVHRVPTEAHSYDKVFVEWINVAAKKIVKKKELETTGFVKDISFKEIHSDQIVLILKIERRDMELIGQNDLYIVDKNNLEVKSWVKANYVDLPD